MASPDIFTDISGDGIRNTVLGSEQDATTHVAGQMSRCDIAWAQAGVKVSQVGNILFEEAPAVGGVNIIADGQTNLNGDAQQIYNRDSAGMVVSRIEVYFSAPIAGANAIAYPPANSPFNHGEHTFVIVSPGVNLRFRTLSHEVGHCLANQPDQANAQYVFFPATTKFQDNTWNQYRRIRHDTETNCRTVRPQNNLNAVGNRILRNP